MRRERREKRQKWRERGRGRDTDQYLTPLNAGQKRSAINLHVIASERFKF